MLIHTNLYYVWKKTIFILASFRGEMGHTVGEVGHNPEAGIMKTLRLIKAGRSD